MPREDCTVMDSVSTNVTDLKEKIVTLTDQLGEVEAAKKASNKAFNDQIKDIKDEIKMTLELIKGHEQ